MMDESTIPEIVREVVTNKLGTPKLKLALKPGWTKEKFIATLKANTNGYCYADGGCVYFWEDKRCPVGAFIPTSYKDTLIEDWFTNQGSPTRLLSKYPELEAYMPLDTPGLDSLQSVHDGLPIHLPAEAWMVAYQYLTQEYVYESSDIAVLPDSISPTGSLLMEAALQD